jgi:hypothetical protein
MRLLGTLATPRTLGFAVTSVKVPGNLGRVSEVKDEEKSIGRNEPCPCGSGKKYKRCHGVAAAPKLGTPKLAEGGVGGGMPPGFDPSQLDPEMLAQFSRALQRLPRGQMQRLQSIMQRAMAGKDVSREAAEFEKSLPPELHDLVKSGGFGLPGAAADVPAPEAPPSSDMSVEEAREIVRAAAEQGKLSSDEAEKLLEPGAQAPSAPFWKRLVGKK